MHERTELHHCIRIKLSGNLEVRFPCSTDENRRSGIQVDEETSPLMNGRVLERTISYTRTSSVSTGQEQTPQNWQAAARETRDTSWQDRGQVTEETKHRRDWSRGSPPRLPKFSARQSYPLLAVSHARINAAYQRGYRGLSEWMRPRDTIPQTRGAKPLN